MELTQDGWALRVPPVIPFALSLSLSLFSGTDGECAGGVSFPIMGIIMVGRKVWTLLKRLSGPHWCDLWMAYVDFGSVGGN